MASLAAPTPARAATIRDPGQGPVQIERETEGSLGLSGLAYAGGSAWYAVGDRSATLHRLTVELDGATGTIRRAVLAESRRMPGGADLEGVVIRPDASTLVVADERGPALREHRLSDLAVLRSVPVPPVFRTARNNRSLESLALAPDGALWTASEEALASDGPKSSTAEGSLVRLAHIAASGAVAQWAYRVDPIPGRPEDVSSLSRSGVVDLAVAPSGVVLVLERAFGAGGFRTRIYAADFEGATEVSGLSSLEGAAVEPVRKALLWQGRGLAFFNFEGMDLGPTLEGGGTSLLLVSDDSGVGSTRIQSLVLDP